MRAKDARRVAGWSLARAAGAAEVSEPTARLYEANPDAIVTPEKRANLDRVYDELRSMAAERLSQS